MKATPKTVKSIVITLQLAIPVSAFCHARAAILPTTPVARPAAQVGPIRSRAIPKSDSSCLAQLKRYIATGWKSGPTAMSKSSWLQLAVRHRYPRTVRFLLAIGADPNRVTLGSSPLLLASRWDAVNIIRILITHGARINQGVGPLAHTPLEEACLMGARGAVKLLIKKGANINAADRSGITPSYDAVRFPGILKRLIRARANVNVVTKDQMTPLDHAAWLGATVSVNMLLAAGANPMLGLRRQWLRSPLDYSRNGQAAVALLNSGLNPEYQGGISHRTAMCYAANGDVVKVLFRAAPKSLFSIPGRDGTPLDTAAMDGRLSALREILALGAPTMHNGAGHVDLWPLRWAMFYHEGSGELGSHRALGMVEALIGHGANVNAGPPGHQPLDWIIRRVVFGRYRIAAYLIRHGAAINAGPLGCRPLDLAIMWDRTRVAKCLVRHGVDLNAGPPGHRPLDLAIKCKDATIGAYLIRHGALR